MDARGPAVALPDAARGRRRREGRHSLLALLPALVVLGTLFGGALLGVLRTSVTPLAADGLGAANLENWRALLHDPAFGDSALFTLRLAATATLAAAACALGAALVLRHRGTAVRALASLPVPVPHLLVAVVAVLWLAPGGLADRLLGGLPVDVVRDKAGLGVVLVYVYKEVPFLVVLLLAAMGRGLADREEAAAVLGASQWQRLRWVVWPTVRGPLVVGAILVGAFVLGAFEVPLTVGPNYPPTLAEYALQATQDDLLAGEGLAAAALLVTALASILLAVLAVRFAKDAQGA